jgi:3-oxoacyl-(acyl-carrier-protein) synthase
MSQTREIVITGLGVVSPIGIGGEAFWNSLCEGRSGVRRLEVFNGSDLPPAIGADVSDFDPKQYVRPRKSLKVMSRDIQLAFAAADLACAQASLESHPIDPERLGIVFGADMIACDLSEMIEISTAGANSRWPRCSRFGCSSTYPTCRPVTSALPWTPAVRTTRSPWAKCPALRRLPRRFG